MAKVNPQSLVSIASTSSLLTNLEESYETVLASQRESALAFSLSLRSAERFRKLRNNLYGLYRKESDIPRIYKETLRAVIHLFNSFSIIDSEEKLVSVKCMHGNPERVVAKLKQEDNIILPVITVTQTTSDNDDARRRYTPLLINERYWDTNKERAFRILSFAPRPINVNYEVNFWCKYRADVDQLLEQARINFNPEADINTPFSTRTKGYITGEVDNSDFAVGDTADRVIKKTLNITVETYIPSPKFLFTSTGKIESINIQATLDQSARGTEVQPSISSPGWSVEYLSECERPGSTSILPSPDECKSLKIIGPNIPDIDVNIRIWEPNPAVTEEGTVILGTGGEGVGFMSEQTALPPSQFSGGDRLTLDLINKGWRVVDRKWEKSWWEKQNSGFSVKLLSGRYTALLDWVHTNVFKANNSTGKFAAVGNSQGSAEIAYALSTWNKGDILTNVVFMSGPTITRLDYMCQGGLPIESSWTGVPTPNGLWSQIRPALTNPTNNNFAGLGGSSGAKWNCTRPPGSPWSGYGPVPVFPKAGTGSFRNICMIRSNNATQQELHEDSIFHKEANLTYPNTKILVVLGEKDCSTTPSQGLFYLAKMDDEGTTANVASIWPVILSSPGEPKGKPHRYLAPLTRHFIPETVVGRGAVILGLLT